jgi:biopolymer transport protein ExbD
LNRGEYGSSYAAPPREAAAGDCAHAAHYTVLVLLITFMVAMPVVRNSVAIELPKSSSNDDLQDKNAQESIAIYIDRQQRIFVDDVPVKRPDLSVALEEKLSHMKDRKGSVVFVHADEFVPYGSVVTVVDDIKYLSGVKYVALVTQRDCDTVTKSGA